MLVVSLFLTACGGTNNDVPETDDVNANVPDTNTDSTGIKDEVVTMAIISTWDTLNIYNTSGNYGNAVADQMFERLVFRTHDGKILPRLADSWEMSDDNTSMVFNLNKDALWHDGEQVTANDIVFTCKAMTDIEVDNYYRSAFNVLEGTDSDGIAIASGEIGVEQVDEHTVKFTFKEAKDPDSILNAFLSFLYILPEHILGDDYTRINDVEFWESPIGAGPFKYVNDIAGETLELEAFTDYYQGSPDFKTLVIRVVPASNLAAGLINGDIDVVAMGSIPLSDWETIKNTEGIVSASVEDYAYQYMLFNLSESNDTFQDPKVRNAFDKAINKKTYNR